MLLFTSDNEKWLTRINGASSSGAKIYRPLQTFSVWLPTTVTMGQFRSVLGQMTMPPASKSARFHFASLWIEIELNELWKSWDQPAHWSQNGTAPPQSEDFSSSWDKFEEDRIRQKGEPEAEIKYFWTFPNIIAVQESLRLDKDIFSKEFYLLSERVI